MPRTITVKGTGKVSARPDYVTLSMLLESLDQSYDKAMELATKQIGELTDALAGTGFAKEALKTTNFDVRTDYNNEKDERGNWKKIFNGYAVSHNLKLDFDFDMDRLSKALAAIANCAAHPQLSVAFTIKDPAAVKAEMLRSAAANAKEKAEILCAASGVKLGELVNIDYNWSEINIHSNTRYMLADECLRGAAPMNAKSIDIEPEDINLNDCATFVWELK